MELSFKDSDFVHWLRLLQEERVKRSTEFVFDDEPLEQILYGKELGGPTSASLYLPALKYIQGISHALRNRKINDAAEKASELKEKGYPICAAMCFELASIIRDIVPAYPNPVMELDLSDLGDLVDTIWDTAKKSKDNNLQDAAGTVIYHWYEHYQRYEDARQILGRLIEICREQGNQNDEAIMINNLAFEYLLEGRYEKATPMFGKASEILRQNGDMYQAANSRANHWECRFNTEVIEEVVCAETELREISNILGDRLGRHARKPLILLARIEAHRGNIEQAIRLVQRAISVCENSKTRYPELDTEYLEQLKSQMR